MPDMSENIKELQAQASVLCAECLRDEIAVRAAALDELADRLEQATWSRDSGPDGNEAYLRVFAEVVGTVLVLATFTAELTKRPADVWVIDVKASAN
jgi:hypothetical protein